jgi:hypothetical protein
MIMLRAFFQPAYYDTVHGLARDLGIIYIGYDENDERYPAEVAIKLVIPADLDVRLLFKERNVGYDRNFYASITSHHDGVQIMRELFDRGFMSRFEKIEASTFYDVLQCLIVAGIGLRSEEPELRSRKMYELLNEPQEVAS